jgi:hypothetical protein
MSAASFGSAARSASAGPGGERRCDLPDCPDAASAAETTPPARPDPSPVGYTPGMARRSSVVEYRWLEMALRRKGRSWRSRKASLRAGVPTR